MSKKASVNVILILILLLFFPSSSISANSNQKVVRYIDKVKKMDVVRAKFGSGSDEIGVTTPSEANPEGPMSFALGEKEEIYILDQLNKRVQIFKSGRRISTIPISVQKTINFKDIAQMGGDKVALLGIAYVDGREKSSIYFIDANGKVLNFIKLEDGRLIPDSGAVMGIRIIKDGKFKGIWVEMDEGRSVRVASPDGKSIERISVPGKLSLNGRRLFRPEKVGDITAVLYHSEEDSLSRWEPERTVHFEMTLVHILGIWDDQKGKIYLGAFLEDQPKALNIIVVFSPEGKELGRLKLFVQKMPHEIWKSIRVSPEGNIFQLALDGREVFIRKYYLTD